MKLITLNCLECNTTFEKEERYVKRGEGKFCSLSCARSYLNNAKIEIELVCSHCNKSYMSKNKKSLYCSKSCCGKATNLRRKGNLPHSRSGLSTKINKAISTGTGQCFVCNWNLTTCDIHHITEKCNGGSDEFDNLTVLCPNCHRLIHNGLLSNPPTVLSKIINF